MEADSFLQSFDSSDLRIAKEFLTNWLPFLTKDLCEGCAASLFDRIQSLCLANEQSQDDQEAEVVCGGVEESDVVTGEEASGVSGDHFGSQTAGWENIKATGWETDPAPETPETPKVRMSWADELEEEEEAEARKNRLDDGLEEGKGKTSLKKNELSREQRELIRFTSVERKKDFVFLERVDGKIVNILEGIELHSGVFSAAEQKRIVDFVYELQMKGRNNELGEHTYSEGSESGKFSIGKGFAAMQFGCCHYSVGQSENPPDILRADPLPSLFKVMIKRLIGWHVMPASCVPDCCSVNICEPGDCTPPEIESHDFVRPFCIVPFLSECNISFGLNLEVADTGEAGKSTGIPIPVGSVLVLNGKGATAAKHWISASSSKRITITFRKMDKNKRPFGFRLEPDLQNVLPIDLGSCTESSSENKKCFAEIRTAGRERKFHGRSGGAKGRRNSRKDGASVFDRITPAKISYDTSHDAKFATNHRSFERTRDSRSFFDESGLRNHPDVPEEFSESSNHGWVDDDSSRFDRKKVSGERSVRVEQKRIIITRNLDHEDNSFARNPDLKSVHPQVRIRTVKNNQRRAR